MTAFRCIPISTDGDRPRQLRFGARVDAEDQCLYGLGQVCEGKDVDAPLARALADPRTAFVNIHTAKPGCLLGRVERT